MDASWPELSYADGRETFATLHLWSQIIGKVRLARTPWLNHSWHVPLYVSARGLTSSLVPHGERFFEMEFDFNRHVLRIDVSDGQRREIALAAALGRRFLCRRDAGARRASDRRAGGRTALRDPRRHPLQPGPGPRQLRCALRTAAVAGPAAGGWRLQALPHRLPRQVQPGAFLLGQLRSGRHAFLRAPRAAVPGYRARAGRRGDARGVFPRGEQRRLLARRRRRRLPVLLLVHLSDHRPLQQRQRLAPRRQPSTRRSASSCCPTRQCAVRRIRRQRC